MKKRILASLLICTILLSSVLVNITAFAALSYSDWSQVNIDSYQSFRDSVLGNAYNTDWSYGAQCWDGASILWKRLGMNLYTAHSYYGGDYGSGVRTSWEYEEVRNANAGSQFELITDIESVRRGDVVIFGGTGTGHIAFADEDYNRSGLLSALGQNQGDDAIPFDGYTEGKFNITKNNTANFLGAFRYKNWNTSSVGIAINGEQVNGPEPVIQDGRTLVPLRVISEMLGAAVYWDDATKTVTLVKDGDTIKMTIGDNKFYKNGEVHYLDVVAQIITSLTYVPIRAIAEAFGCLVNWDAATRMVTISVEFDSKPVIKDETEIKEQNFDDLIIPTF